MPSQSSTGVPAMKMRSDWVEMGPRYKRKDPLGWNGTKSGSGTAFHLVGIHEDELKKTRADGGSKNLPRSEFRIRKFQDRSSQSVYRYREAPVVVDEL